MLEGEEHTPPLFHLSETPLLYIREHPRIDAIHPSGFEPETRFKLSTFAYDGCGSPLLRHTLGKSLVRGCTRRGLVRFL